MAFIQIKVDGITQVSRNLRVLSKWVTNMKPFFSETINIVEDRSNELFKTSGSNVEKAPKWKPLSPSTNRARKNKRWYYKRTPRWPWVLRWTRRLQEDVTKTVNKYSWSFKFNSPYAIMHHRGWKNLPKRALIDLSNKTNTKIVKSLQKLINKQIWIFNRQA